MSCFSQKSVLPALSSWYGWSLSSASVIQVFASFNTIRLSVTVDKRSSQVLIPCKCQCLLFGHPIQCEVIECKVYGYWTCGKLLPLLPFLPPSLSPSLPCLSPSLPFSFPPCLSPSLPASRLLPFPLCISFSPFPSFPLSLSLVVSPSLPLSPSYSYWACLSATAILSAAHCLAVLWWHNVIRNGFHWPKVIFWCSLVLQQPKHLPLS